MGKNRGVVVLMILTLCVFLITSASSSSSSSLEEEEKAGEKGVCVSRRYLDMLKGLFNQANLYFSSPPNLDFRGDLKGGDPKGGGEKVKEAAVKSMEKSKATMEGSARSAAEMTGKTIRNTKERVKKSFSEL
ncbi:hypothetical protein LWI29_030205 [Acer saccharum]|uniref:Uncharacterized protein n=1 Tax=Acer saccharum TaxID=4024 RepID=A0AA39W0U4_ACESA|nr:hypothetical protein LWI29_030205 [Acer saccharum]